MRTKRRGLDACGGAIAAVALTIAGLVAGPTTAGAQTNPYERGPAPTPTSVTQQQGPFAFQRQTVQGSQALGFNRGTIYYPTDTSQGTFGAVAVSPGFVSGESTVSWAGPFLASNGFVVMTIETFGLFDFPDQRADQLQAALDYLAEASPSAVRNRIDPTRLALMGHSMGGGGTLEATMENPELEAAVALQPWHLFPNFGNQRVPSMIISAQNDVIAANWAHSFPYYDQIPASAEKALIEVGGTDHFLGYGWNPLQGRSALSWLKRYVDDDTRYSQFLCPPPSGTGIVQYRDTCPD